MNFEVCSPWSNNLWNLEGPMFYQGRNKTDIRLKYFENVFMTKMPKMPLIPRGLLSASEFFFTSLFTLIFTNKPRFNTLPYNVKF